MSASPFWSGPIRYLRWAAHERPNVFYSLLIGAMGMVVDPLTCARFQDKRECGLRLTFVQNRTHLATGRAADSKEDGVYEIDTAAAVVPGYATLIRSAGSSIY